MKGISKNLLAASTAMLGLSFCMQAQAQISMDPNWGTTAGSSTLNCISADCGGGGVGGGDSDFSPFVDNVQELSASSAIVNPLGNASTLTEFVDVEPGLKTMVFTGQATSSITGIARAGGDALALYSYSGPDIDLTITATVDANFTGPLSGEDGGLDGVRGRFYVFTDEFSIQAINDFEFGASLSCLFECYIPDAQFTVLVDTGDFVPTASTTISLTDGDQFYLQGSSLFGAMGGGSASVNGDGIVISFSTTAGLTSIPGSGGVVDSDGDGVGDDVDNCLLVENADQRDTNSDGYGNSCDPDVNNDGIVNFLDVSQWALSFNTATTGDEDFNGDGFANFVDFALISEYFLGPPGPSAIAP